MVSFFPREHNLLIVLSVCIGMTIVHHVIAHRPDPLAPAKGVVAEAMITTAEQRTEEIKFREIY